MGTRLFGLNQFVYMQVLFFMYYSFDDLWCICESIGEQNLFYKLVGAVVFIVSFPGNLEVFLFSYTNLCSHNVHCTYVIFRQCVMD